MGTLLEDHIHFYRISLSSSEVEKCFRHKLKKSQDTPPPTPNICEITLKNIVEPYGQQMTVWHMRCAC